MSIYKVTTTVDEDGKPMAERVRLVRATLKTQARKHVANKDIAVEPVSDDDLIKYTKEGVELEDASKE